MTLNIGDQAPDFEAETTEGRICFHKWIGNRWCVLFSHPDEPAWPYKPAFDERNVRLIGLSINGVDSCARWASDIRAAQGFGPEYPIICDPTFVISDLWGISKPANDGNVTKRTEAYNQIARSVFVIGPDKTIKLVMICERAIERNFYRIIRFIVSQQLVMGHKPKRKSAARTRSGSAKAARFQPRPDEPGRHGPPQGRGNPSTGRNAG